jgi:nucleotide-binding universal stress UspA family protein
LRITTGTGVAQTIESVAEEEGFPTIVMNARGKGFLPGIPLGSVSEGVLHCTKRDLLIMRYRMIEEMTGIRYEKFCPMILSKILVATDLSPESSNAIMRLVKTEGVGEIILVHVISRGETEAEIIASEEAARTTIREHCNQIHQEGLQSRGIVLTGDPASVIIDLTEEQDVSMVCTVPHGKGFMQRLLYGSFSGDLARHVNRPLLIIHNPE